MGGTAVVRERSRRHCLLTVPRASQQGRHHSDHTDITIARLRQCPAAATTTRPWAPDSQTDHTTVSSRIRPSPEPPTPSAMCARIAFETDRVSQCATRPPQVEVVVEMSLHFENFDSFFFFSFLPAGVPLVSAGGGRADAMALETLLWCGAALDVAAV